MAVNHFRIGGIIFAKDLFTGETFKGMHNDVFKLLGDYRNY
jgi:hypothetical protein